MDRLMEGINAFKEKVQDLDDSEMALAFYQDFADRNRDYIIEKIEELFNKGFSDDDNWILMVCIVIPLSDELNNDLMSRIKFPKQNYLEHFVFWFAKIDFEGVVDLNIVFKYLFDLEVIYANEKFPSIQGGLDRIEKLLIEAFGEDFSKLILNNVTRRLQYNIGADFDFLDVNLENPTSAFDYFSLGYYATVTEPNELKAIQYLRKACDLDPTNSRWLHELSRSLRIFNRYDDAILNIKKAIEIDSKELEYYELKSSMILEIGKIDEGIMAINQTLDSFPDGSSILYENLSYAYDKKSNLYESLDNISKAIALSSQNIELYIKRGWLYYKLKDYQNAELEFQKAFDLNDVSKPQNYFPLVDFFRKINKFDEALKVLSILENIIPDYPDIYNFKGMIYLELRDYNNSILEHSKAIEINPKDPVLFANRGWVYYELKNYQCAELDYLKAIELNISNDLTPYNEAIVFYRRIKNYKSAFNLLTKALEIFPNEWTVYNQLGLYYLDLEKYVEAHNNFQKALVLNNSSIDIYNNIAVCFGDQRNWEDAIDVINKAIEIVPTMYSYYYKTICYLQGYRNYPLALENVEEAIKLDNSSDDLFLLRGEIRLALEDFEGALQDYNKAFELIPNKEEHTDRTADIYYFRSLAKIGLKEYASALEDQRKVSKVNPTDIRSNFYRELLQTKLHQDLLKESSSYYDLRWAEVYGITHPAMELDGDFYHLELFKEEAKGIHFSLGDVSGKGAAATLVMSTTLALISKAMKSLKNPGLILNDVNSVLVNELGISRRKKSKVFVTAIFATLESKEGKNKIYFSNAGHMSPLVYRKGIFLEFLKRNIALGVSLDEKYEEESLELQSGDILLFYTDGIIEQMNPAEEQYSLQRLKDFIHKNSFISIEQIIKTLIQDVKIFADSAPQQDDITMVGVKLK